MKQPKILVTGSNGQVGSELRELAAGYEGYEFLFFGREDFSIQDESFVKKILEQEQPDYLVNCAAYTAVDQAEKEQEQSMLINGRAVGYLAAACKANGTRFLHISTDYVFNGTATQPIREDSSTDPVNYYGQTKLEGEQQAMRENPASIIIRTSWVYSSYGKNFVKTMMRLMREKDSLGVVNDQRGAPTYARDLAEAILHIITNQSWVPGIYHFSNEGNISWYEFAEEIRSQIQSTCQVNPITTDQFPTPARRPSYSVMDLDRIRSTFGIRTRNWKDSLRDCLAKIRSTQS